MGCKSNPIEVSLCGISEHAIENLIPAILQVPQLKICTAVTRDASKRANLLEMLPDCSFVDHLRHLPPSTELVVAAGSPAYNLEAYLLAESMGAAAFVEKPIAPQFSASKPSRLFHVGYNLSFSSSIGRLVALKDTHGSIEHLRITYNTNKPSNQIWNQPNIATSFLYAVGCHPIHLGASVFGFDELTKASLVSYDEYVFLDVILKNSLGFVCVLSAHNRAPSPELAIEAHFADGSRVTLTNLHSWRTYSQLQLKDTLSERRFEALSSVSTFNLSEDITGFKSQFRDLAQRLRTGECANTLASFDTAIKINGIIEKILNMSSLPDTGEHHD